MGAFFFGFMPDPPSPTVGESSPSWLRRQTTAAAPAAATWGTSVRQSRRLGVIRGGPAHGPRGDRA